MSEQLSLALVLPDRPGYPHPMFCTPPPDEMPDGSEPTYICPPGATPPSM